MTISTLAAARKRAYELPLDQIDVSDINLFQQDTVWPYFERLRKEAPVHYCANSKYGPFWSITRYHDIMSVDTNHQAFSSADGVTILPRATDLPTGGFIAMDPPRHDEQRKTVSPIVAPGNLAKLEATIRARVCVILDQLPIGETFNWVDKVSIELTTQMLATLLDFPFEDRHLLTYWSDVTTTDINAGGPIDSNEKKIAILGECLAYFTRLWNARVNADPRADLISMLAHSPSTRHMQPKEFLGNIMLLIVGGNDTTRNSISGGLWFLDQNPDQYRKLRQNPHLIPSLVPEIIRYQTPLAHMRRVALVDTVVGGKTIRQGDKVIMWYASGNRDETAIPNPDSFIIDRERPRQHISFGFGIHRCVGNRLAELQLAVLWEEILKRGRTIEVVGAPERVMSNLVRGYTSLPVRISA